jgi:hypothetical protein
MDWITLDMDLNGIICPITLGNLGPDKLDGPVSNGLEEGQHEPSSSACGPGKACALYELWYRLLALV